MPAPKGSLELQQAWRDKIKSSEIINRLNDHALGLNDMSQTQLKAAEIVLKKTMPDLKAIEHSGEIKAEITAASSAKEWLNSRIDEITNASKPIS